MLDTEKIEVVVRTVPGSFIDEVFIFSRVGSSMTWFDFSNGDVIGHTEQVQRGQAWDAKPAFRCEDRFTRLILAAFMAAGEKQGVERPSESKVAGLYEAQSKHLDDMRWLLKLSDAQKVVNIQKEV